MSGDRDAERRCVDWSVEGKWIRARIPRDTEHLLSDIVSRSRAELRISDGRRSVTLTGPGAAFRDADYLATLRVPEYGKWKPQLELLTPNFQQWSVSVLLDGRTLGPCRVWRDVYFQLTFEPEPPTREFEQAAMILDAGARALPHSGRSDARGMIRT